MKHDHLLDTFRQMTVIELSEFVKDFETTFGVKAATPVTITPDIPVTLPVEIVEEPLEYTVILESFGEKKIQVIKEVRSITKLGLAEAKALVDDLPKPILVDVPVDVAEQVKAALVKAGAGVTVRSS